MKKIILFALSVLTLSIIGFTENLVLENLTSYPTENQKSKIALQWATSAKEVDESNIAMTHGLKLNQDSLQPLSRSGKISVTIPKKAEYFRIVAWSKNEENPDFLTNWVDVVPNKTYTIKDDHLVPSVLMSGTGC